MRLDRLIKLLDLTLRVGLLISVRCFKALKLVSLDVVFANVWQIGLEIVDQLIIKRTM